jgi:hypothetical protein
MYLPHSIMKKYKDPYHIHKMKNHLCKHESTSKLLSPHLGCAEHSRSQQSIATHLSPKAVWFVAALK